MNRRFLIEGGRRLVGQYAIQGNKNAALPLISAALLAQTRVRFRNLPRIVDVENLLRLVEALGVRYRWEADGAVLDSRGLRQAELPSEIVGLLRGAILLLGSLGPLWGEVSSPLPGGCPLGRRSFDMHWKVFREGGFSVDEESGGVLIRRQRKVTQPEVYLEETSVTATENALILFASLGGGTIHNPAREPHIFNLIEFLRKIGCRFELHPLYFRVTKGPSRKRTDIEFTVAGDYIDAGTLAVAAAATGGQILLTGISRPDMTGVEQPLRRFGLHFDYENSAVRVGASRVTNPDHLQAGPWPLFPTDLTSLAVVLATQGEGICLIHDWMYESRMFFVDKLVRMGARITLCDPHRCLVSGPASLRGTRLESPDIRAGMALVIAGLCARGTTTIEHAEVILRGYENVVSRFSALGAEIKEA